MISFKLTIPLCLMLCFFLSVFSHESRKHEHYSFNDLRGEVNGDSLTTQDQQRLFDKLHLLDCSENKTSPDYRKCFTPKDLLDFDGSAASKSLNSSEFAEVSPLIIFCLLPARERNSGQERCDFSPRNHSELFNSFARNFSSGVEGITHEALDRILEDINKTIGQFLTQKKCFSAKSIFEEIKEEEHHEEENHTGEHHEEKEKALDQHDFEKACASIILHLVQGYCIEEGHGHNETESKLPSREFFIKDIFKNKTHLTEEDLEEITKLLGIGKSAETSVSSSSGGHDGHNHRRRRSAAADELSQQGSGQSHAVHRRAADSHDHDSHDHDSHAHDSHTNGGSTGTCYSLDNLLTIFHIDHSTGADSYDFQQLCPAFIQQAKSGACKAEATPTKTDSEKDLAKIWGYGLAAVTIISLTALVGVITIPFLEKKLYKNISALLVALAVGTLSGDSLLHLLPHAFGLHAHEEEGASGHDHSNHSEENHGFIWKALVVLAAIYVFFLFETLMHLGLKSKMGGRRRNSQVGVKLPSHRMSFKQNRNCSRLENRGVPPFENNEDMVPVETGGTVLTNVNGPIGDNSKVRPSCSFHCHEHCVYEHVSDTETEDSEFETAKAELADDANGVPQDTAPKPKETFKSSLSQRSVLRNEEGKQKTLRKISAVAWMIIIGDALHNVSDGLAIGAAFSAGGSSGISGGISTSIAVFCHELPHELGDFAVLLSAGMSVKMALLANLLSALTCYIGLAIGIYAGQQGEARFWIFALAGGIFLYVALVDMLPELMHSEALQAEPCATFLVQNIGMLLGFGILLIIALYEEDLKGLQF